jgi:hypothetical protein
MLVGRDIARTRSGQAQPPAADAEVGDRQANAVVVGLFAILLLVGLLGWNAIVNATTPFSRDGVSGAYPSAFTAVTAEGELLRVTDPLGDQTAFFIRAIPLAEGQDAGSISTLLAGERGADSAFYRVTGQGDATLAGRPALRQEFAYVDEGGLVGATPRVVEGVDYLVVENGRALVISMLAGTDLETAEAQFEQFISSLKF